MTRTCNPLHSRTPCLNSTLAPLRAADPNHRLPVRGRLDRLRGPQLPQHCARGQEAHREGDHHRRATGHQAGLPGRRLARAGGQRAAQRLTHGGGREHHSVSPLRWGGAKRLVVVAAAGRAEVSGVADVGLAAGDVCDA